MLLEPCRRKCIACSFARMTWLCSRNGFSMSLNEALPSVIQYQSRCARSSATFFGIQHPGHQYFWGHALKLFTRDPWQWQLHPWQWQLQLSHHGRTFSYLTASCHPGYVIGELMTWSLEPGPLRQVWSSAAIMCLHKWHFCIAQHRSWSTSMKSIEYFRMQ